MMSSMIYLRSWRRFMVLAAMVLMPLLIAAQVGYSQGAPFYKDKTIRIIVGFTSGGLYDQYALAGNAQDSPRSRAFPFPDGRAGQQVQALQRLLATNATWSDLDPIIAALSLPHVGERK